jgi:uncharacterized BrkB/YihY/UPF0761 family membrane protein
MTDADLFDRSAQVAFYFSFSLFPLLFFISLFGLVLGSTEGLNELFQYVRQLLPIAAYDLYATVEEISQQVLQANHGRMDRHARSASAGVSSIRECKCCL